MLGLVAVLANVIVLSATQVPMDMPAHGRRSGQVIAYIGVRGGSKRCPRKNIKPFWGDLNLIDLKIRVLQQVPSVDGILVSSDDDEMLAVAAKYPGVKQIKKPAWKAGGNFTTAQHFENMGYEVGQMFGESAKHVIFASAVAPLLEPEDYSDMIEAHLTSDPAQYDGAAVVLERTGHFWLNGKPINYDPLNTMQTQMAPRLTEMGYATAITQRDALIASRSVLGFKMPPLFITKSLDRALEINECLEFEIAQFLYQRRHGPAPAQVVL